MAKKPFFDTKVGAGLKTLAAILAPNLITRLEGVKSVADALGIIRTSDESHEVKAQLQDYTLKQYEIEVEDRVSARKREADVAASGGSDILFKTIGWSVAASFLVMISGALGLWDIDVEHQRGFDMAFGAVVAKMTAVVSYYFGSSIGSKQKTTMMQK